MKHDIRINMTNLKTMQKRFETYAESLHKLKVASTTFHGIIKEQHSRAYEKLSGIWEEEIMEAQKEWEERFSSIADILQNYINAMESFMIPNDPEILMRVDDYDICHNVGQIMRHTEDIYDICCDTGSSWKDYKKMFVYNPFESDEENEARRAALKEEEEMEQARRERNYNKLEAFRKLLEIRSSGIIKEYVDGIDRIYTDSVVPFVECDNAYSKKLGAYYDEWKDLGDSLWDAGVVAGDFIKGAGTAGLEMVKGASSMANFSIKYNNPCGIFFAYMDEDVQAIGKGVVEFAKDPENAIESVFQEMSDNTDEKGTAYAVGYIAADVAAEVLLSKGMGKLAKAAKLEDVGDIVTISDDLKKVSKSDKKRNIYTDSVLDELESFYNNIFDNQRLVMDEYEDYLEELRGLQREPYVVTEGGADATPPSTKPSINQGKDPFSHANFKKGDIKMVNDAANQVGVDRKEFGNFIHEIKKDLGMKANQNFTYQELIELAEEFANMTK